MNGPSAEIALPYSRLAADYDRTIGIPFFCQTRDAFERLIRRYGISFRSAADIGCGTGLFARYLKMSRGVSVFAIDASHSMLRIAAKNCCGTKVRLMHQDIRCLRLPQKVDLITANFDTLNHLLTLEDLRQTLRRVFENLNPGGHFIFDVVTNCVSFGPRPYIREFRRQYRRVSQMVRTDPMKKWISIVVSIQSPNMFRPIFERHCERVYAPAELGGALHEAGFTIRGIHDAATDAEAYGCPQRVIVVARRSLISR